MCLPRMCEQTVPVASSLWPADELGMFLQEVLCGGFGRGCCWLCRAAWCGAMGAAPSPCAGSRPCLSAAAPPKKQQAENHLFHQVLFPWLCPGENMCRPSFLGKQDMPKPKPHPPSWSPLSPLPSRFGGAAALRGALSSWQPCAAGSWAQLMPPQEGNALDSARYQRALGSPPRAPQVYTAWPVGSAAHSHSLDPRLPSFCVEGRSQPPFTPHRVSCLFSPQTTARPPGQAPEPCLIPSVAFQPRVPQVDVGPRPPQLLRFSGG